MRVLLLTDGAGVSIVSAAVAALVVIFLTLPMVFLLVEHLQKRGRAPSAEPSEPAKATPRATQRRRVAASRAIEIVERASLAHDFADEEIPRTLGHIPPDTDVVGDVSFAGYLQVGERVRIEGGVETNGSLALGAGAEVTGRASAGGTIHVGRGARIQGETQAGGDVHAGAYSALRAIRAEGALIARSGARLEGAIAASRIERPLDGHRDGVVGDPLAPL